MVISRPGSLKGRSKDAPGSFQGPQGLSKDAPRTPKDTKKTSKISLVFRHVFKRLQNFRIFINFDPEVSFGTLQTSNSAIFKPKVDFGKLRASKSKQFHPPGLRKPLFSMSVNTKCMKTQFKLASTPNSIQLARPQNNSACFQTHYTCIKLTKPRNKNACFQTH